MQTIKSLNIIGPMYLRNMTLLLYWQAVEVEEGEAKYKIAWEVILLSTSFSTALLSIRTVWATYVQCR